MDQAPRVNAEELKRRVDAGEEVVILDVRRGSWERSDVKIKGAVRMELQDVLAPDAPLPRGAAIVAYCT
jgi:rhodanese-related sulfurtransferase